MTTPAPLVPAECVMTGNDWFPFHFDRLRKSKWWRRASDVARARNVMMWGEAYKSAPAGSLADDDDELAEAAGYGMDVDAFLAVKDEIMAPWVLCSDGRWYHPTVCEVVLDAWDRSSDRKKAAAERQRRRRDKVRGVTPKTEPVTLQTEEVTLELDGVTRDSAEVTRDFDIQDKTVQNRKEPPIPPMGAGELELVSEEPSSDQVDLAFRLWNVMAEANGLPVAKVLDDGRRRAIRKRLEDGGLDAWTRAVDAVSRSRHCRGENDRKWRADIDFVCQPKSWRRLLEGTYGVDAEPVAQVPADAPVDPADVWTRRIQAYRKNAYWNRLEWGPAPGKPGCTVAAEILMASGYVPSTLSLDAGRAA